jgi:predicted outer membrane protein
MQRRARALPREQDRALAGALSALHDVQQRAARLALLRQLPDAAQAFARRQLALSQRGQRELAHFVPLREPFGQEIGTFGESLLADLGHGTERDFADAYGHAMVRIHQEALIWLNERLLPEAWDTGLRIQFERTRRQTLRRLDEALQLLRNTPSDVEDPSGDRKPVLAAGAS